MGGAWIGKEWHGRERHGLAGGAGRDMARIGAVMQVRRGEAWCGPVWSGRLGVVWRGTAR